MLYGSMYMTYLEKANLQRQKDRHLLGVGAVNDYKRNF